MVTTIQERTIMKNLNAETRPFLVGFALWLAVIMPWAGGIFAADGETDSVTSPQDQPPGACRLLTDSGTISFPFDIFRGDIRFQCEINGHKVQMLLDDGYIWDELLFWGCPQVDSLDFHYDGTADVGGGNPGDSDILKSRTASDITVRLPGVEFTEQKAVITPSSSGTGSMWWGSAGQISAMLFKHFIVDINFDKMLITLIKPENFKYEGQGAAVAWEPMGFGPRSIPANLVLSDGREISLKLLMDLGYNDQLQLWTGKENKTPVPDRALPADLGMNIQGIMTRGFVGRLSRIKIGGYEIDNLLAAYVPASESGQSQCEAMIGLGLLSRFNLTFDYYGHRLVIEPNKTFRDPFEYNMSGFSLRKSQEGFLEIEQVYDHSPAREAGLRVGDRVLEINGKPADVYDYFELESLMMREGRDIRLRLSREGKEWETYLKLKRLI